MDIDTVLVANRGEIALRVFRTCRRLGLRTVAVHTDLDADAPHVREADEAVRVPSYLDGTAVVAAAKDSGADAVHPGYGFLSENASFAQSVLDAGLTWVGPSPEVIVRMGRKDAARRLAVEAGVPVVPSYGVDDDPETLSYPVLVKAAAGGGGKGMRIVRRAEQLPEAMAAARREAANAFGDDTLLVERYVERGRHIEVQVLGDSLGKVIHLLERDCSVQRRHQKVIEEAPAPGLDPRTRARLRAAAVALAKHVGYAGAGTVEFLLDTETEEFYFLEMNTRLQVEHPVTEMVTGGIDLVSWQLRVAAGEELGLEQSDLGPWGHAIEVRVYAEDPYAGFLPQAGTATYVRWPRSGERGNLETRVDHALESGQVVSTAYDPMLGKVIVHGPDREAARRGMLRALDETVILGLTTNTGFLRELVAHELFRSAAIDTAWLDRTEIHRPGDEAARILAAWAEAMAPVADGPWAPDGWRLSGPSAPLRSGVGSGAVVRTGPGKGQLMGYDVVELARSHDGDVLRLELRLGGYDLAHVGGPRHLGFVRLRPSTVEVVHRGQRHVFERPDVFADHGPLAGDGTLIAPMPGTVLEVRVAEGEPVQAGQVLGVVEAMKMELPLTAPFDGTVVSVGARPGHQVALGATLFVVEQEEA